MRVCNQCKEEKSLDCFYNVKSFPLGKAYTCKPCSRTRSTEWNRGNKERKSKAGVKHYQDNKEKYMERAQNSTWKEDNRERVNETARLRDRGGSGAARVAKRRAAVLQRTPTWADHTKIKLIYKLCSAIGRLKGEAYHVDHRIPLQGTDVSGLHVADNLHIIKATDNLSKSNSYDSGY